MKFRLLFFLVCFLTLGIFAQDKGAFWVYDMDQAQEIAENEDKNIMIYFTGSDWCRPCMMLQEDLFKNYKFEQYKKSHVFLYVDIPRNKDLLSDKQKVENYKLLESYNKGKTFPLIVAINKKGKVLDEISGYSSMRDPSYYFSFLKKNTK